MTSSPSQETHRTPGSRELREFANTMDTLYKVVRCVNSAYYSGDLHKAFFVMLDSLKLFRRLNNKKAIGVACNNLGNILFVALRRMQQDGETKMFGYTQEAIVSKGIEWHNEAIKLGEKLYDEFYEYEGWTPGCLSFMQHLSNRYFNRGMLFLVARKGHKESAKFEELGRRDLQISHDMDVEITDQGQDVGWGRVNRAQQLFEVALVRLRGYFLLHSLGYHDDWEVGEVLSNAFELLQAEWMRASDSSLFHEITRVGRLQQIEEGLMRYKRMQSNLYDAAVIGSRLLMEDEYVLPHVYAEALTAIRIYVEAHETEGESEKSKNVMERLRVAMELSELARLEATDMKAENADGELAVVRRSMMGRVPSGVSVGSSQLISVDDHRSMECVTMEDF